MNKEQENAFNPFNYNLLMERIQDKNTIEHKQYKEAMVCLESASRDVESFDSLVLPLDYEKIIKQRNK